MTKKQSIQNTQLSINISQPAGFEIPPPVTSAHRHALYPEMNHDERARMNFLAACNRVVASTISPGNQLAYDTDVLPKFQKEKGRAPENRSEVRKAMNRNAFHNIWGAVRRNLMEIRQQAGRAVVLRQAHELAAKASEINAESPNLVLNDQLELPV